MLTIEKLVLALHGAVCSKTDMRPVTREVYRNGFEFVATNGHVLAKVEASDLQPGEACAYQIDKYKQITRIEAEDRKNEFSQLERVKAARYATSKEAITHVNAKYLSIFDKVASKIGVSTNCTMTIYDECMILKATSSDFKTSFELTIMNLRK